MNTTLVLRRKINWRHQRNFTETEGFGLDSELVRFGQTKERLVGYSRPQHHISKIREAGKCMGSNGENHMGREEATET